MARASLPFACAAFLIGLLVSPASLAVPPDKKVKKNLDKLGLVYEIDADNDFKLVMSDGVGRTQLVFVASRTFELGDMTVREVFSPGGEVTDALAHGWSQDLLARNHDTIIGSWSIQTLGERQILLFSAKVPADLHRRDLQNVIDVVAAEADHIEEQLTGADEF